jgi:hypothetical protein
MKTQFVVTNAETGHVNGVFDDHLQAAATIKQVVRDVTSWSLHEEGAEVVSMFPGAKRSWQLTGNADTLGFPFYYITEYELGTFCDTANPSSTDTSEG